MAFWNSKPSIPNDLPKGGLLSEFGGPESAVQYRVWVKNVQGKEIFFADPEFQGAYLAWRRVQQDLSFYPEINLPVAVVWDPGIKSYREVEIDTFKPWIKSENRDWYEAYKAAEKIRIDKEKAEILAGRQQMIDALSKAAPLGSGEIKKKSAGKKVKKGAEEVFVPEITSSLQAEEARESQKIAAGIAARAKEEAAEEKEQGLIEENPRRKQTMREFIRENRSEIDQIIKSRHGEASNDAEREEWIENDEGLYTWAKNRVRESQMNPLPGGELKNEWKNYICSCCGHIQPINTNHYGGCWDYCKNCSWKAGYAGSDDAHTHQMFGHYYHWFEPVSGSKNNPRVRRNPSYAYVYPFNREAYVKLAEWTASEGWQWQRFGTVPWQQRVLVSAGPELNDLVDSLEEDGFVFMKKEGQKVGPADYQAVVAW